MDVNNPLAGMQRSRSMVESAQQAMVPSAPPSTDLRIGPFAVTPVGLKVDGLVDERAWLGFMARLKPVVSGLQWIVGDWINLGESTWGKTYQAMSDLTGLDIDTLTTYAYVARSVQFSIRIENLSFSHHRLVAALPESEQQAKLDHAASKKLSLAAFRSYLNGKQPSRAKRTVVERFQDMALDLYEDYRGGSLEERLQMADLLDQVALALRQENPAPARTTESADET